MSQISDREKEIEKYIKENPDCKQGSTHKERYKGKLIEFPVFRIPIELLTYNLENGRFAADLLAIEAQEKRKLDMTNDKDIEIIENLLLTNDPKDTKELKTELINVGQKDPATITSAGNIINANRRVAVLKKLLHETGDEKYAYLETMILPRGTDAAEIWKIEARIQYGQDFKVDYGPVNELLKIRDARDKKIPIKVIANELGESIEEINKRLERLTLIEEYLKYIKQPKNYKLIQDRGLHEHFIDTQDNLKKFKDEELNSNEIHKFLKLHFEAIKAEVPHREIIRKFKEFVNYDDIKKEAFSVLDKITNNKINQEEFERNLYDIVDMTKAKKRREKPVQQLKHVLDLIEKVGDFDIKLDSECKKILSVIISIAQKLKNK